MLCEGITLLEVKRGQQLKTNNFLLIKVLVDVRKTGIQKIKEHGHNTQEYNMETPKPNKKR